MKNLTKNLNKKQIATIDAHNAKIDADDGIYMIRIADTISGDIMRDER